MTDASKAAASICDVAEPAGVNPSTVTQALSKPGRVSAPTETLVRLVADRLNCQVNNPTVGGRPAGRSHTAGFLAAKTTTPYVFGLIHSAEHAAHALKPPCQTIATVHVDLCHDKFKISKQTQTRWITKRRHDV